jgi:iron(III) transport system ATP-binding protein
VSAPLPPVLSVRSATRRYGGFVAVDGASLTLRAGRITCLLGPSGCGKSTLLRLIAGLEQLDSGMIEAGGRMIAGDDAMIPPEARGIGLVFQDFALFPHLTVAENVAFGLKGMKTHDRRIRAEALLAQFRLAGRGNDWPHHLSGGEQQRVAIARALAREPAAVMLDEPFSGLDGDLKAEVRHAVLSGLRQTGTAVLIVTHDPEEALLMADDLALMARGRILQTGSPADCYLRPSSIEAARMLGETNVLSARVEAGRAITAFGALPAENIAEGEAQVMVRPEGLRLDPQGVPVEVVRVRFGGPFHEVTITAGGNEATLRFASGPVPDKGPARVSIDPERAIVFPGR